MTKLDRVLVIGAIGLQLLVLARLNSSPDSANAYYVYSDRPPELAWIPSGNFDRDAQQKVFEWVKNTTSWNEGTMQRVISLEKRIQRLEPRQPKPPTNKP